MKKGVKKQLRVAVMGQGRSGMDIHCAYFLSEANKNVKVVYVVDALEIRRKKAENLPQRLPFRLSHNAPSFLKNL